MSGLYFDVFPADDPNGDALGELTEAYGKQYQGVHQAIGSGQFTINRSSSQVAWAAADNLVRVRRDEGGPFDFDDARYIGAFWIESGTRTLLSEDEEGGRELTMGGRGPEAALRWAILYPDAFDSRNDPFVTQTRIDGNWHIPDRTAGEVLAIFLRDLDDRTPDPLPFISRDFGVGLDSTGTPWSDTDTDWAIPVGTNGLDLLATCVSGGLFYRVGADFLWHAYEDEPGTDLSASITLSEAVEIAIAAEQDIAARETVGRVLVQGTKEGGRLKYREVINATVEGDLPGRREGFVEYRRTPTNAKLDQAGNRFIRKSKRRHDGPLQLAYVERSGAEAFTDFVPGDIVTVDIPGPFTDAALRVYAISLEEDEAGNVTPVVDFEQSPFDPNQGNAEFDDGNGNGTGVNCGDCPPLPPHVPNPIPGDVNPTTGGILYQPGNSGPPATSFDIFWGSTGDNPGTGYGMRARDAASFDYIGAVPTVDGWEIVAPTATLDLALQITVADAIGSPRTYTFELLLNGSLVASAMYTASSGFVGIYLNINVTDLAVVAGDLLTTRITASELAGLVIPWGTGDLTNRFEILDTSTVGGAPVTPDPLDGQEHSEELAGDGSTTEFQTNFPYAENSLEVHVDGLLTPVTQTDPSTGTFTFDTAPADGAVIIIRYQNAGTTGTGATNPEPVASTPAGAASLIVQDEGTPLATAATTLNFTGAGVTASGAGATKTINIPGGGASLPWFDVTDYGATGDNVTDDTTAVQDAIDACITAGGGTVYFPPGTYYIGGALQNTSTHNSQLVIPQQTVYARAIRFLGFGPHVAYGNSVGNTNESIIRSDWNGSISGNPAIISAGTYHGASSGFSAINVTVQDLTIIAHDDPKLTALQFTAASNVQLNQVQIRTTTAAPASLPTHANAAGYEGPWGLASTVPSVHIGVDVYGFYTGIVPEEQFTGTDIGIAFCLQAVWLIGGPNTPTYTHYPVVFTKLTITLCPYGIVFTTDVRWVQILMVAFEHDTGTFASIYDINDPNNYAYGFVDYHVVDYAGGVGTAYDININNGRNLSFHWGAGKFWLLNSQVQIPKGTNPTNNPPTGFTLYADSTSGHPTIRDSAGATTDLLTGTGPSFATPAVVLGTAAAAGAATTVIRSDSTIVAFDATAPSTQALGDAAATGSAAVAARRDHKHAMPALSSATPLAASGSGAVGTALPSSREDHVHPIQASTSPHILLADGHSTPFSFNDLLQMDDGSDFMWSDA